MSSLSGVGIPHDTGLYTEDNLKLPFGFFQSIFQDLEEKNSKAIEPNEDNAISVSTKL